MASRTVSVALVIVALALFVAELQGFQCRNVLARKAFTALVPSPVAQGRMPTLLLHIFKPVVGEAVMAEVDDIGGTVKDPVVDFLVRMISDPQHTRVLPTPILPMTCAITQTPTPSNCPLQIKDGRTQVRATMPTKNLTPVERLLIQAGSKMQVYVSRVVSDGAIEVALKPPAGALLDASFKSGSSVSKPRTPPVKKEAKKPDGLMLNQIKIGMKMEGVVVATTNYAAFVNVKAYRASKGGSYMEVNGMLHRSDMPSKVFASLDKGYPITVYAKEVYKNSGRFTLTTDPTISKAKILQMKEDAKIEGNERRRARRMRRQMDKVTVGDTVSGFVQRVIPEGVLVTVTSLGPLNITGLLGTRDMPKQFQVPSDLKPSFQKQLLEQDFVKDRPVTCAVQKISSKSSPNALYNFKLTYEGLGARPDDDVVIPDGLGEIVGDFEDDATDADEDTDDDDLMDIYAELKGKNKKLLVADFKDWADIQDMVDGGDIDQKFLDETLAEIGGKEKALDFQQFKEVVDILQDSMEGTLDTNFDEFSDDDSDDDDSSAFSSSEEGFDGEGDEEIDDMIQEIFDDLRGKDDKVGVAAVKEWEDVKEMIAAKLMTSADLDEAIKSIAGAKKSLDFEQFYKLVELLDDIAADGDEPTASAPAVKKTSNAAPEATDDDDTEEEIDEEFEEAARELFDELRGKADKVSVSSLKKWGDVKEMIDGGVISGEELDEALRDVGVTKTLDFDQFCTFIEVIDSISGGNADEESDGDDDDDDEEEEEGSQEDILRDLFDELRGKDDKVSVEKFKKWGELQDMLSQELIADNDVDEAIAAVGAKKVLDFLQFSKLVEAIDDMAAESEGFEEGEIIGMTEEEVEGLLPEYEGEAFEEVAQELFDELRGKSDKVSVAALKEWEDVKEMIESGVISSADLDAAVKEVGATKALDFEQFCDLIEALDAKVPDADLSTPEKVEEGESFEEVAQELFDELRGKSDKVSVAALKEWEDVKEMIASKVMSSVDLDEAIKSIAGAKKSLDFEQFYRLVELLDDFYIYGTDADDKSDVEVLPGKGFGSKTAMKQIPSQNVNLEDDENIQEILRESFDSLKGKNGKVTVKALRAWDEANELISSGIVSKEAMDEIISQSLGEGNKDFDFEGFCQVVNLIDDSASASVEATEGGRDFFGAEDDELVDLSGDEMVFDGAALSPEELDEYAREVFDQMRGDKNTVSLKTFMQWSDLKEMISEGILDKETVDILSQEVGTGKGGEMSFEQFKELLRMVDEAAAAFVDVNAGEEVGEEDVDSMDEDDEDDEDEEDDEDDGEDLSPEELEAMAQELFDELKGKNGKVTIKVLKAWEGISDVVESGELTMAEVDAALKEVGAARELDFKQFSNLMDILDGSLAVDEDDGEDEKEDATPKGFGTPSAKAQQVLDDADTLAKEIFDELRGKRTTLSLKTFRAWDELQEMLDEGMIKHSTLEKALKKIGSLDSGELDLKQFIKVMDIIKENVDASTFVNSLSDDDEDEDEDEGDIKSSSKVLSLSSDDDDNDDDEVDESEMSGGEEVTEEEAAREIYDELKKPRDKTLGLADFIQWSDVQELLQCGALSKDNLAKAIENTGVTVESDGLTFEQFFDLLQIIDEYVDQAKLPVDQSDVVFESRVQVDSKSDVDRVMDLVDDLLETGGEGGDLKVSYINKGKKKEGLEAISAMQKELSEDDDEDEDEDDDDEPSDEEVIEMFNELSKGKPYITEKALRKWDELQELVEAEIASRETIDEYLRRIEIKDGKVDLPQFQKFISLLDMVLVDDNGNVLGLDEEDRAANRE